MLGKVAWYILKSINQFSNRKIVVGGDIFMPKDTQNQHVQASPHPDGIQENVINDSTASAGDKISVFTYSKQNEEFGVEKNPYHLNPKKDLMMERFEKLMKGHKKE